MAGSCIEGYKGNGVKRWRQKAVDWEEVVCVNKEAEVLRGPHSQGVSK